jgi:glutathione synthase/RimK-type ligase-like ATP-grasp enzyme
MYNLIDKFYESSLIYINKFKIISIPYIRRFFRFLALPYAYFFLVNWKECTQNKFIVAFDFVYIFFVLKDYPDNYSLCRLWELNRDDWKYYYGSIYNPYNRARLSKYVQPNEYCILFDDKEVCYQLCQSANLPLPRQFAVTNESTNIQELLCQIQHETAIKKFIIKPAIGKGGEDIYLINFSGKNVQVIKNLKRESKTIEVEFNELKISKRSVIQEYVNQHKSLKRLSPNSLNTIRIATMLTKSNTVIILGSLIRIGHATSIVDNSSSGGVAVGIKVETGTLNELGYDFNSKVYKEHPSSNFKFSGFHIPFWKEILKLATETQLTFPYYKLLGIDIGLSEKGPILIEINASHDNVGLEQKSGPILARPEVLNAFREYDLLSRRL